MARRRIALLGICSLLLATTTALAAPTNEHAVQGPYRGTYVCQTKAGVPGIFRIPIDLVIRNGNVEFSRPLLNWNGTRVVGNEMASGTIDGDGKVHLTSMWFNGRALFHADYSGMLTPSGGTFMGTQTWHGPRGLNGSRTCAAAFVQLAATNQSPAQQSLPEQSPLQQPSPDQSAPGLLPDRSPSQQ